VRLISSISAKYGLGERFVQSSAAGQKRIVVFARVMFKGRYRSDVTRSVPSPPSYHCRFCWQRLAPLMICLTRPLFSGTVTLGVFDWTWICHFPSSCPIYGPTLDSTCPHASLTTDFSFLLVLLGIFCRTYLCLQLPQPHYVGRPLSFQIFVQSFPQRRKQLTLLRRIRNTSGWGLYIYILAVFLVQTCISL
jgi:hypothetical protein